MVALGYALRREVRVTVGRVFNVTGPGEPEGMLCGAVASQIAAIERRKNPPILKIGNLSPIRDYVDVRDMVRALWLLSLLGDSGRVYNVASGVGTKVETVVRSLVRLSALHITLAYDYERARPSDIPYCVGDFNLLAHRTGWEPRYSVEESLQDTLAWWRKIHPRQKAGLPL